MAIIAAPIIILVEIRFIVVVLVLEAALSTVKAI